MERFFCSKWKTTITSFFWWDRWDCFMVFLNSIKDCSNGGVLNDLACCKAVNCFLFISLMFILTFSIQ